MTRTEINRKIGVLVHAVLKLDEEYYRQIVNSIDPASGGYVRNIKDEEAANIVLLHLQQLADKRPSTHEEKKHERQENFIPVLMELLGWNWSNVSSFIYKVTQKHHHTSKCDTKQLSDVIRGMIAIIDHDIEKGKLVLTEERKKKYHLYTKNHRLQNKAATELNPLSKERSEQCRP